MKQVFAEWTWIWQTSNMHISFLGYYNDIAVFVDKNGIFHFPPNLSPNLRPTTRQQILGKGSPRHGYDLFKFEQVAETIKRTTDFPVAPPDAIQRFECLHFACDDVFDPPTQLRCWGGEGMQMSPCTGMPYIMCVKFLAGQGTSLCTGSRRVGCVQ